MATRGTLFIPKNIGDFEETSYPLQRRELPDPSEIITKRGRPLYFNGGSEQPIDYITDRFAGMYRGEADEGRRVRFVVQTKGPKGVAMGDLYAFIHFGLTNTHSTVLNYDGQGTMTLAVREENPNISMSDTNTVREMFNYSYEPGKAATPVPGAFSMFINGTSNGIKRKINFKNNVNWFMAPDIYYTP